MAEPKKPLNFSYDEAADILTIEGIRYTGDLFRTYGGIQPVGQGQCLAILKRRDGVLYLRIQRHFK